jgi:sarcosine oxidase subunit alpha
MSQINRIDGGLIDQEKVLNFTFNGQILKGYEGDTLASALLANNKHLIGRSFKYIDLVVSSQRVQKNQMLSWR